jgi:hypothetical protein
MKIGVMSNRINQMISGERVVRNDEAVGSIPTSSTIFSTSCTVSFSWFSLFSPLVSEVTA